MIDSREYQNVILGDEEFDIAWYGRNGTHASKGTTTFDDYCTELLKTTSIGHCGPLSNATT
jgi:hypothetical protein